MKDYDSASSAQTYGPADLDCMVSFDFFSCVGEILDSILGFVLRVSEWERLARISKLVHYRTRLSSAWRNVRIDISSYAVPADLWDVLRLLWKDASCVLINARQVRYATLLCLPLKLQWMRNGGPIVLRTDVRRNMWGSPSFPVLFDTFLKFSLSWAVINHFKFYDVDFHVHTSPNGLYPGRLLAGFSAPLLHPRYSFFRGANWCLWNGAHHVVERFDDIRLWRYVRRRNGRSVLDMMLTVSRSKLTVWANNRRLGTMVVREEGPFNGGEFPFLTVRLLSSGLPRGCVELTGLPGSIWTRR